MHHAPSIGALGSAALQQLAQHDVRADHLRAEPERQEANLKHKRSRKSALTAGWFAWNRVLLPREASDCGLTPGWMSVDDRMKSIWLPSLRKTRNTKPVEPIGTRKTVAA